MNFSAPAVPKFTLTSEKKLQQITDFRAFLGGIIPVVECSVTLSRFIWTITTSPAPFLQTSKKKENCPPDFIRVNELEFRKKLFTVLNCEYTINKALDIFTLNNVALNEYKDGRILQLHKRLAQPIRCCEVLLGTHDTYDADRRYWVARCIRNHYNIQLTYGLRGMLQLLTDEINYNLKEISLMHKHSSCRKGTNTQNYLYLNSKNNCIKMCKKVLSKGISNIEIHYDKDTVNSEVDAMVELFFEACRLVDYIRIKRNKTLRLFIRTEQIDCEYIISHLFGCSLSIPGLNELFGGNGPILSDQSKAPIKTAGSDPLFINNAPVRSRTMVIHGEIGCGKSLLALQMAVEVARKGGVAYMLPLEQSVEECLYTLQTSGFSNSNTFRYCVGWAEAEYLLEHQEMGMGILMILPLSEKNSLTSFYEELSERAAIISKNSFNLIVVDPLNAINKTEGQDISLPKYDNFSFHSVGKTVEKSKLSIREETAKLISAAKGFGVNLLLVVEDPRLDSFSSSPLAAWAGDLSVASNLSDTVILMTVKEAHEYTQRKIAIQKSRYQREQRGEHCFTITPNNGLMVFPSPAAVAVRVAHRKHITPNIQEDFGHKGLDDILRKSFFRGDIMVFTGPGSSFKTQLGCNFLRQSKGNNVCSFLFAARDSKESVYEIIKKTDKPKTKCNLVVQPVTFPKGYISPGSILWTIEDTVLNARREGWQVDRIMIDNLEQWDMSFPLIKDDPTFGVTLVQLLRGLRLTALLAWDNVLKDETTPLQQSILRNADCVVQFERFEFRGQRHVTMRVAQSRGLKHRLESYEVHGSPRKIMLSPSSSLLRLSQKGAVKPVSIRLFLHVETEEQISYCNSIESTISSILTTDAKVDFQDKVYFNSMLSLGNLSAMDELQILQLDEYQLALHSKNSLQKSLALHQFQDPPNSRELWDDISGYLLPSDYQKIPNMTSASFSAVPFYQNPSLFIRDIRGVPEAPTSWKSLARDCWDWQIDNALQIPKNHSLTNPSSDNASVAVYFDFPKTSSENYNCLFLEILLSLLKENGKSIDYLPNSPLTLLRTTEAIEALTIFRQLGRRAYITEKPGDHVQAPTKASELSNLSKPYKVNTKALIWRHWYSTASQMISDFKHQGKSISQLAMSALPGDICIAGEWYLGLPAYSAAPEAGLEVIRLLTSRNAELNRLRMGIGLPIRNSFYQSDDTTASSEGNKQDSGSENFFVLPGLTKEKCYDLMKNSFRRSYIEYYHDVSSILATHLIRLLEADIPGLNDVPTDDNSDERYDYECEKTKLFCRSIIDDMVQQLLYVQPDIKNIKNYRANNHKKAFPSKF